MGVLGKVYSIIAPLSSGIDTLTADKNDRYTPTTSGENDYASVLKLATMAEPNAQNTIMNVDKNDNDEETVQEEQENEDVTEEYEEKPSIFSRFKLFGRKDEDEQEPSMADQDPFFKALHNSFQNEQNIEPTFGSTASVSKEPTFSAEPSFSANENSVSDNDFMKGFNQGLSATNQYVERSKETSAPLTGLSDFAARLAAVRGEAVQQVTTQTASQAPVQSMSEPAKTERQNDDNEDLVYPFGGWGNEAGNE